MGMTLANQLTIVRMVMIPLIITLILSNHSGWAVLVFVAAGLTDLLDGLIARRYRQSSSLGAFLDPMADKLLMTACFIVLSIPNKPQSIPDFTVANHVPIFLTIVVISRDVFIVMVALVIHLTSGLTRFTPTFLGKLTTATQIATIGIVLLLNALGWEEPLVVDALAWMTLAVTLASGLHYIYFVAHLAGTEEPPPQGSR